jgi:hypothetical protein
LRQYVSVSLQLQINSILMHAAPSFDIREIYLSDRCIEWPVVRGHDLWLCAIVLNVKCFIIRVKSMLVLEIWFSASWTTIARIG